MYKALLTAVLLAIATQGVWAAPAVAEIQKAVYLPKLRIHFDFNFEANSRFDGANKANAMEVSAKRKTAEEMEAKFGEQRGNAEFLLKLAKIWDEAGDEEKSKTVYRKLKELLSGKEDAGSKELRMEAASNLGELEETEKLATDLLKLDPKNAEARLMLADVQFTRARHLVVPGKSKANTQEMLEGVLQLPEAQMEKLDRLLKEALSHYRLGLELASNEFGRYLSRASAQAMAEVLNNRINGKGGTFDVSLFLAKSIKEDEAKKIAATHQDNAPVLIWVVTMGIMRTLSEAPSAAELPARLQWLEKEPQLIPRVEHFLEAGNPDDFKLAGNTLTLFAIQSRAFKKGAGYARKLVQRDPQNYQHWQSYLNFLEHAGEPERLIQEAKASRLYGKDSWTHLKMARAYEVLQKKDEVSAEIEYATRVAPDEKLVRLFACFWVIKNSDPKGDDFVNYGGILSALDQMSEGDGNWVASIAYTRGFYYALRGITVLAQKQFERAEAVRPGDEDIAKLQEWLKGL